MDIQETFAGIYKDLPVLVTGHTGFKGTWLSMWLNSSRRSCHRVRPCAADHA